MIAVDSFPPRPKLDDPWRRLPWLTPAAALLWAMLLLGFTLLLRDSGRPTETITRLDARLIDVPAAGLEGEAQQQSQPVAAPPPPVAAPQPRVEKKPAEVPAPRARKKKEAPPPMYDARGARTLPAEAVGAAGEQAPQSPPAGRGVGGLGTDSNGARALYAPPPQIPDDLRENVFETVAVAHFHIGIDGDAKVSLIQPTSNPRLNVILLDALKQWRFFPAIRNGIAIDSDFDIRIPIAVRDR